MSGVVRRGLHVFSVGQQNFGEDQKFYVGPKLVLKASKSKEKCKDKEKAYHLKSMLKTKLSWKMSHFCFFYFGFSRGTDKDTVKW